MNRAQCHQELSWQGFTERAERSSSLTVICHAPTNNTSHGQIEEFYSILRSVLDHSSRRDVKILLGKLNAKIGHDKAGKGRVMRRHGLGCVNKNGEQCTYFCPFGNFSHKAIHNATWMTDLYGWTKNSVKPGQTTSRLTGSGGQA